MSGRLRAVNRSLGSRVAGSAHCVQRSCSRVAVTRRPPGHGRAGAARHLQPVRVHVDGLARGVKLHPGCRLRRVLDYPVVALVRTLLHHHCLAWKNSFNRLLI